jgi:hypothetical protein
MVYVSSHRLLVLLFRYLRFMNKLSLHVLRFDMIMLPNR